MRKPRFRHINRGILETIKLLLEPHGSPVSDEDRNGTAQNTAELLDAWIRML